MHGEFSKSSGIVLYKLTHLWGVPVLCTQAISVSSRGQQTGRISSIKDRKTSKRLLLKTSSVVLLEKCLVILLRPTQAVNKPSKNRRKFLTYQLAWTCPTCASLESGKGQTSISSVHPSLRFVSVTPFDIDKLRSALICHFSSSTLSRKQTKYSGKQSKEINLIPSA